MPGKFCTIDLLSLALKQIGSADYSHQTRKGPDSLDCEGKQKAKDPHTTDPKGRKGVNCGLRDLNEL